MVAEQREQVQRIDADTIDIANNVQGAQRELLKYYASISSNRWLMMKVFGVIIVFVSRLYTQYLPPFYQNILLLRPAAVPYFHPSFIDSLTFISPVIYHLFVRAFASITLSLSLFSRTTLWKYMCIL